MTSHSDELTNIYQDHGESEIFLTTLLFFFISESLGGNLSFRERNFLSPSHVLRERMGRNWIICKDISRYNFLIVCEKTRWFVETFSDVISYKSHADGHTI